MKIKINNVKLFYDMTGSGSPVILLHGVGQNHKIFNKLVPQLKDKYTVYTMDNRGNGKSQMHCEVSYPLMASDVITFINELKIEKPIIIGTGDGAIVALLIAMYEPEMLSKAIVCGANLYPAGLRPDTLAAARKMYSLTKMCLYNLMLTEPNITPENLGKIQIPVHVLAGEKDMVRREHVLFSCKHMNGNLNFTQVFRRNVRLGKHKIVKTHFCK